MPFSMQYSINKQSDVIYESITTGEKQKNLFSIWYKSSVNFGTPIIFIGKNNFKT